MKRFMTILLGVLVFCAASTDVDAGLCYYWSLDGCKDHCSRGYQSGGLTTNEYLQCMDDCRRDCGGGGGGGNGGNDEDDGGHSPIVIKLDKPLAFTSPSNGVLFDIDGDGGSEVIAWTDPAAGNGFLALDRNGNGSIDSGQELFGNYTQQPPSAAPNGFLALGVFDSDGDGSITAADAVFAHLSVWIDANYNGRSEQGELSALDAHGIVGLDLGYKESRRRDEWGNELRYRARVDRGGPPTVAVDVFFQRLP